MPLGPSQHLSWAELACHDPLQTPYPDLWRDNRARKLAFAFEWVRQALGGLPLFVVSGYRTPEWNRHVGGARYSQHVAGRAVDLAPPRGVSLDDLHHVVLDVAHGVRYTDESWLIRGVGRYPTFIHLDVRPTTRLVVWDA